MWSWKLPSKFYGCFSLKLSIILTSVSEIQSQCSFLVHVTLQNMIQWSVVHILAYETPDQIKVHSPALSPFFHFLTQLSPHMNITICSCQIKWFKFFNIMDSYSWENRKLCITLISSFVDKPNVFRDLWVHSCVPAEPRIFIKQYDNFAWLLNCLAFHRQWMIGKSRTLPYLLPANH